MVKKLNKWILHELTKNQKYHWFELSSSLILWNNNKPFLNRIVMCDEKWILYNWWQPVQCLDWKEAPKPNLYQKRSRQLFSALLTPWHTTALWVLAKPWHPRIMLSKSMRCTENCNTCSRCWSTKWAQFFSMTMPDHTLHNQWFKCWTNGATNFCLICHIHLTSYQRTTTSLSILTTFCRENASITSRRQKMLSKG